VQKELPIKQLRRRCDEKSLGFKNTGEISTVKEIIGQQRAVKALKFGLEMKKQGFNIYVAGRAGTGRETAVKGFLETYAKNKGIPSDLCYVNNFRNPYEPKAIELPPGKAKKFKNDMLRLIEEATRLLPEAFKSDNYAAKRDATLKSYEVRRKKLYEELNKKARKQGFVLQTTPTGLLIIPIKNGKPVSEQEFVSMKPEMKTKVQRKKDKLGEDLRNTVRQLKKLEGKGNEALKKMNREVALFVIKHLVDDIYDNFSKFKDVTAYLNEVQDEILDNISQFLKDSKDTSQDPRSNETDFKKFAVNVIVDNSDLKGAPVIIEHNPTFQNLFGRIEKESRMGILSTDFTMIHGGSLHKANGGFLVLTAEELLQNMFSWEGIKRALMNSQITIEEAGERLGFITTKGLRPEPVPLSVKVVLIGNPLLYHLLYTRVMEFKELFKVKAEFDTSMQRNAENEKKYVGFICTFCTKEGLKHFDASAVSRIIDYGSRLAENQNKLSTKFADIGDIMREANLYATQAKSKYTKASHIKRAIEEKTYRSNLIQEKTQEMIEHGLYLIDTKSEIVGQVNGLSVISMGDISFGRPSRLTVTFGMGKKGIIDIEREVKLGGPIHSKGVMILSGYLTAKYAQNKPLSLTARIVFEQSYGGIDGDSASSTELYALLSSLSGLPIKQALAVTGSINQKGEVQAIGGVNEKIEGFFEICKIDGLSGKQGVLIPASNVQNLMLRDEVLDAVKSSKFHIYPIVSVDQGIEILTGVRAGMRKQDGTFPKHTINYMIDNKLMEIAENLKQFPEHLKERDNNSPLK